jgi:hypothetical protein
MNQIEVWGLRLYEVKDIGILSMRKKMWNEDINNNNNNNNTKNKL